MSINTLILNKQIEIFIKDFFIERLLNNETDNDSDYYIDLRDYLNDRVIELKKNSGIDFSTKEYQKSLISSCMKLGVMDEISGDKQKAMDAILEIINDQFKVSDDVIDRLSFHIRQAYKSELDINKLYAPVYFDTEVKPDKELHKNINEYFKTSKTCDVKEFVGVINSFLETSNWPQSKIKELLENAAEKASSDTRVNNAATFQSRQSFYLIKSILTEINNTSLVGAPFDIKYNELKFNRRKSSEFDHFMYSPETKTFSICLATKSKSTKIEKNNVFSQPISLLYICNSLMSHLDTVRASKNFVETPTALHSIFSNALTEEYNFRSESIKGKSVPFEDDDEFTSKNIKSFNKRPNLILKNLIAQGELPHTIIKGSHNIGQTSVIESFSVNNEDVNKLLRDNLCSFKLNEEAVEKLFSVLNSNSEFKTDIYFFGEVSSKRSKQFGYSTHFSDEEVRAGANILAYAGRAMDGFDGIEITPSGAIKFLEKLKFRFNTSTNQKQNCVDLIKLNEKLRDIGGVLINDFMQNENLPQVIKLYKNDNGASKGLESLDVLHNISLFEKNVIGQMIEGMEDMKLTPEEAYVKTLGEFNTSPRMTLDKFINNLEQKLTLINDEVISGNLDKLSIFKHKVETYRTQQKELEQITTMIELLKNQNVDIDIIKNTTKELLISKGVDVEEFFTKIFKEDSKNRRKNQI